MADRTPLQRFPVGEPICLCDHPKVLHRPDLKREKCEAVVLVSHLAGDTTRVVHCDCPEFSQVAVRYMERRWVTVYENEEAS